MDPQQNGQPNVNTPPAAPQKNPFSVIRNMSTKKKIILAVLLLLTLAAVIALVILAQRGNGNPATRIFQSHKIGQGIKTEDVPPGTAAIVGDNEVPEKFLEYELKYYPATPSAEAKKNLKEKLVDDQIALEKAKEQGLISDYPNDPNMTEDQYLERTKLVQQIKEKINEKGNIVRGKMVMVWFYNNMHIGPKGFEGSKQMAYEKIKPLYDQVAAGQLTIDQAGMIIKNDTSIKEIDPVWQANAIAPFVYYQNGPQTHWPEFNKLIWETEPGNVTPLHLGGGILRDGKPVDELYIFAYIDAKSTGSDYNDYYEWLEQQRQEYDSSYSFTTPVSYLRDFFNFISTDVYADDDNNNGSRSGAINGYVRTQTGAPIPGARVHIWNGAVDRNDSTDGNGRYDTGVDYSLSCLNNPQHIEVTYDGRSCGRVDFEMPNGDAVVNYHFTCSPPPPPPPPPVNRCNQECTEDSFCAQTTADNCSKCLPNPSGSGKTCQPPPPPIQCNAVCTDDTFCANAVNGCTHCLPNPDNPAQRTCQQTPRCGNVCVTPADCNGAQNGCTLCLPDQQNPGRNICQQQPTCGSACSSAEYCLNAENNCTSCIQGASGATCGSCPSGMVYDPTTKSCNCPIPGETNPHKVCDGDKCLDVASCGVSTCGDDKQCFAEEMCKCDGFEAVALEYPSTNPFVFESFAKVEGTDMTKAYVEGISFRLFESDKNNPNSARVIAQSPMYTPEIVSSTASKARYKATWSMTPPQIQANKLYRVQADIKCSPKKRSTRTAMINPADNPRQYQSKVLALVKEANAQGGELEVAGDDLQLRTLNFVRKVDTDMCRTMTFEYNAGVSE